MNFLHRAVSFLENVITNQLSYLRFVSFLAAGQGTCDGSLLFLNPLTNEVDAVNSSSVSKQTAVNGTRRFNR
jgi:hypothetical protein